MPTQQGSTIHVRQPEEAPHGARIKVVGVGGGGNNAIDRMIASGMEGVEFVALNTDIQALKASKAAVRQQIGARLTQGLGAGSDPDIGRRAAMQDSDLILEALDGADMVFVTAGLGGGTGTGAAPVIAALASEMGALTVAIVTRPFGFEGKRRMAIADWGIHHLLNYVDTLIVIPNEKLLAVARDAPFFESFRIADDFLRQAVQGISDIITTAGVINRDFADVKTTMAGMGYGVMGTASRSGPNRATEAVMGAMASPLLEAGAIDGARGILINVTGSSSLRLSEVNAASTVIQGVAHEDANIIFGAVLDERLGDEVKVTVIATGFREEGRNRGERRARMLRETGIASGVALEDEQETMTIPVVIGEDGPGPNSIDDGLVSTSREVPEDAFVRREPGLQEAKALEAEAVSEVESEVESIDETVVATEDTLPPELETHDETKPVEVVVQEEDELLTVDDDLLEAPPDATQSNVLQDEVERAERVRAETLSREEQQPEAEVAPFEDEAEYVERRIVPVTSAELALPESPILERETVRLTHFRRAAMAAYAAAAQADEESEPVPTEHPEVPARFAEVLAARRRFVETQASRELEDEPALSVSEERAIEVLMEAMSQSQPWDEASDEPDEEEQALVGEHKTPLETERFERLEHTPEVEEPALLQPQTAIEDNPIVASEAAGEEHSEAQEDGNEVATFEQREFFPTATIYENHDEPRPLPDFKRRLQRETAESQAWLLEIRNPAGQSDPAYLSQLSVADESAEEIDELDIPAFMRRGRS